MIKRDVIKGPSCLTRADADEPIFVLRAKDPCAPRAIEEWAQQAAMTGSHEKAKIRAARIEALEFRLWRLRTLGEDADTGFDR